MIQNYRIPVKQGAFKKEEFLHISDDSELKDALYSKSYEKAKVLSFKNSNIKDDTLKLLWDIKIPLGVIQLDLSQNFSFITDTAVEIITQLTCLKHLKILNLADNQISDDSMVLLSKAASMNHLEQLILFGNTDVTGAGLLLLSQSPFVKHLKVLDLHATSVDDEGIHQFMRSENCQDLQKLNLSMSWKMITNKALFSIANSKYCKNLKELLLEDCKVGDQGVDELCQSQNMSKLLHLSLNNSMKQSNNIITDKTLASISLSKYMVNLKILELRNTDVTARGIKSLSITPAAESIEMLRLSHCKGIDGDVLAYLQKLASKQSLKKVYLNECKIDQDDLKSFEFKNQKINLIF